MKYLTALALLIWSTACVGQTSRYLAEPNSWVVVIGAVKECPSFDYQILDAQYLRNRASVPLVGALMNNLTGLSGKEIEVELQGRDDLSPNVLPQSLKVLVYKAGLPPEVLKRIIIQATGDTAGECKNPTHRHYYQNPRLHEPYRGDGPDDLSIETAKKVT